MERVHVSTFKSPFPPHLSDILFVIRSREEIQHGNVLHVNLSHNALSVCTRSCAAQRLFLYGLVHRILRTGQLVVWPPDKRVPTMLRGPLSSIFISCNESQFLVLTYHSANLNLPYFLNLVTMWDVKQIQRSGLNYNLCSLHCSIAGSKHVYCTSCKPSNSPQDPAKREEQPQSVTNERKAVRRATIILSASTGNTLTLCIPQYCTILK